MVDFAIEMVFEAIGCILDLILDGASDRLALRWKARRRKAENREEKK